MTEQKEKPVDMKMQTLKNLRKTKQIYGNILSLLATGLFKGDDSPKIAEAYQFINDCSNHTRQQIKAIENGDMEDMFHAKENQASARALPRDVEGGASGGEQGNPPAAAPSKNGAGDPAPGSDDPSEPNAAT